MVQALRPIFGSVAPTTLLLGSILGALSGASPVGAQSQPINTSSPGQEGAPAKAETAISPLAALELHREILRQLKPFWNPPAGSGGIVTRITFALARDGTLKNGPDVISQSGETASESDRQNHARSALYAVQRAAPFKLPADLYDAWQSVEISFNR